MIPIKNSNNLNILLPNTNKALSLLTNNLTNEDFNFISKDKDLKSVLYSLLKQTQNDNFINNKLLQLIKNNPTLQSIGEVPNNIKDLLSIIKADDKFSNLEKVLNSFLTNLNDSTKLGLKEKFETSGIFLESKLKDDDKIKDILTSDLKAILLNTKNEVSNSATSNQLELSKQIDKLLLQIDYHQLVSHLTDSSSLFIPFSWDLLEKGNIRLKKAQDDKFFCDINLQLKEYGELNLKLTLYDKNKLNIHIYSNHNDFKNLIRDNISNLRSTLINLHIKPNEIKMFKIKENIQTVTYQEIDDNINLGFEVMG